MDQCTVNPILIISDKKLLCQFPAPILGFFGNRFLNTKVFVWASRALLLNKYPSLPLKCQPKLLPLQMGSRQVCPSCWHGDCTDTEKGCWEYMLQKKHDKGEGKRNFHTERGVEEQEMNHYRIVKFSCFFLLKTSEAAPVPL